jgi:hypothetical protein
MYSALPLPARFCIWPYEQSTMTSVISIGRTCCAAIDLAYSGRSTIEIVSANDFDLVRDICSWMRRQVNACSEYAVFHQCANTDTTKYFDQIAFRSTVALCPWSTVDHD